MTARWRLTVLLTLLTGCAHTTPSIVSTSRTGCEVVVYRLDDEAGAEQLAKAFCRGNVERAGTGYYQRVWEGNSYSAPTIKFDCAEGSGPDLRSAVPTRIPATARKGGIGDQCTTDEACGRGLTCRTYATDRPARCIAVVTITGSP